MPSRALARARRIAVSVGLELMTAQYGATSTRGAAGARYPGRHFRIPKVSRKQISIDINACSYID
ncbi:hypothetical protein GCM10017559_11470 [Streptosporangium longisporum]|uniref:Uncharacterized protein n=1 Tax=Streptosporangium longisporum TaxID=46187 RepID=A0ABN3XSJ6_9ACTN